MRADHPSTFVLASHYVPAALKAEGIDPGDVRPTELRAIEDAFNRRTNGPHDPFASWLELGRLAVRRGLGEQRLFELRRTS